MLGVPHGYNRPKIASCISKLSAGQRQAMWGTLRNAQTQTVFAFPLCKFFHLPICGSCMQKPPLANCQQSLPAGGAKSGGRACDKYEQYSYPYLGISRILVFEPHSYSLLFLKQIIFVFAVFVVVMKHCYLQYLSTI